MARRDRLHLYRRLTVPTEKACTLCRAVKPLADYGVERASRDGHTSACKECTRARDRARQGARDRVLKSRAYGRATAALRAAHQDEFDALYAAALADVEREAQALEGQTPPPPVHGPAEAPHPAPSTPRLMPGARGDQETPQERVRVDVARCPSCVASHDRGHRCLACGQAPQVAPRGLGERRWGVVAPVRGA